jgi:hypothetical protein
MPRTKQRWRTLFVETVYDNPWIQVEDHEVLNPAGKKSQYGKVCFKNRAVAILAVDISVNFLARDLAEGPTEFEDTENLAIRMLPLAEALDWVHQGQITDAIIRQRMDLTA